mgnify:CR=1 FL=1
MDNTIIPYTTQSASSESELEEYSSDDENSHLLSNNIGIHYNKFTNDNFMNMENTDKYKEKRNKYFTPELEVHRILIDTKNIDHTITHNTSNYTIHFDGNNMTNKTSGYGVFNNVIGFKLIKAIVPNSAYTVNKNNYKIIFTINTHDELIELGQGKYTFNELATELQNKLNTNTYMSNNSYNFSVSPDNSHNFKYVINKTDTNSPDNFQIKWADSEGYAWRLFGFLNLNTDFKTIHKSSNVVQQNIHFVDLVIPEIPYIACKKNSNDKNIIDRIPFDSESGSIVYYSSDINRDNYFYPINLDKITIELYEDTTDLLYDSQNGDNSFEFELTILNGKI